MNKDDIFSNPIHLCAVPVAKWSAFVLRLPSGTLGVYIVKLDRQVVERKDFERDQTLEMVEYLKGHAFINSKWLFCGDRAPVDSHRYIIRRQKKSR